MRHTVRVCGGETCSKYTKNVRHALFTVRVCGDGTCSEYTKSVRHALFTVRECVVMGHAVSTPRM